MKIQDLKITDSLDCAGHLCPVPIIMTEEKMADLKKGDILEVVYTDPGAKPDLEAWCKANKHQCLGFKTDKRSGRAYIQKSA